MRKDIETVKALLDDFPVQMELHDTEELATYLVANGVIIQKHGHWVSYLDGDSIMPERYYQCSVCGKRGYRFKPDHCSCGSRNI